MQHEEILGMLPPKLQVLQKLSGEMAEKTKVLNDLTTVYHTTQTANEISQKVLYIQ
jgi:hypothetical protein